MIQVALTNHYMHNCISGFTFFILCDMGKTDIYPICLVAAKEYDVPVFPGVVDVFYKGPSLYFLSNLTALAGQGPIQRHC